MGEAEAVATLAMGDLDGVLPGGPQRSSTTTPPFRDAPRQRVVALQSGDAETLSLWRSFVDQSIALLRPGSTRSWA